MAPQVPAQVVGPTRPVAQTLDSFDALIERFQLQPKETAGKASTISCEIYSSGESLDPSRRHPVRVDILEGKEFVQDILGLEEKGCVSNLVSYLKEQGRYNEMIIVECLDGHVYPEHRSFLTVPDPTPSLPDLECSRYGNSKLLLLKDDKDIFMRDSLDSHFKVKELREELRQDLGAGKGVYWFRQGEEFTD